MSHISIHVGVNIDCRFGLQYYYDKLQHNEEHVYSQV